VVKISSQPISKFLSHHLVTSSQPILKAYFQAVKKRLSANR
jgi:hypothetical protein